MPAEQVEGQPTPPHLIEVGSTGLKRSAGLITEEFLPDLQGDRGRKTYRAMADNEPIIGGAMRAIVEVIGRLPWAFRAPDNATPEEQAATEFVQGCLEDMDDPWDVTLTQIMSMLTYGWSLHEVVFKTREGRNPDPARRSRYADGRLGWRKFAIRGQDTLSAWEFDDRGTLLGMYQQDPATKRGRVFIPLTRALLFRTDETRGNPEGRSLLRNAYRPWYYKTHLEEIEAIGVERDLAGMPVAYAPLAWFTSNDPNLEIVRNAVKHAKRNEVDGLVLPAIFDEDKNRTLTFELLTSGGSRQIDTNAVIGRYNNAIVTSMLMDFLTLGHEGVGSYSLGTAKINMWQLVVESLAQSIANVINQHAVPRLLRLNGWNPERLPELDFGDVSQADLSILGVFLAQMVQAGVIVPDETMENWVRDLAGAPPVIGTGGA